MQNKCKKQKTMPKEAPENCTKNCAKNIQTRANNEAKNITHYEEERKLKKKDTKCKK